MESKKIKATNKERQRDEMKRDRGKAITIHL